MNKEITIRLSDYLPSNVSSRDIISQFLEKLIAEMKTNLVYLDFSKISFISRSAAHELIKMKERFEYSKQRKKIEFIKLDDDVAEMIRIVGANMIYPSDEKRVYKPKKINLGDLVKI